MGDPTQQVHDFEPGIAPSGLFWTIPIEPGAIKVDDYHDILNALGIVPGPAPVASRVSFDVRWAGHGDQVALHDPIFGFAGQYVTGPATISFTASNDKSGVVYTSDPMGQSNVGIPAVGTEQNGVFFH